MQRERSGSARGGGAARPPVRKRGEGRFSESKSDRMLWLREAMMESVSKPRQMPYTCARVWEG